MKKKTSTALVIPATIIPRPRKEDIITAMTERALVKHQEESEKLEQGKRAARSQFDAAVLKELKIHPDNFEASVKDWNRPEVEYTMILVPAHITKLKQAVRSAPSLRPFDFAATKKRIREGMSETTDRVKALLDNKQMVDAMDAALSKALLA